MATIVMDVAATSSAGNKSIFRPTLYLTVNHRRYSRTKKNDCKLLTHFIS